MGDARGLERSRVVSRFSDCHQPHGPNGDAVASVGKPCEQVSDRDLLLLVHGSGVARGKGHARALNAGMSICALADVKRALSKWGEVPLMRVISTGSALGVAPFTP